MRTVGLALGVVLAASVVYDPYVLVLTYEDAAEVRIAATSRETCETAQRAVRAGRWLPSPSVRLAAMWCEPGDLFQPGSTCIAGYNCPMDRR